MYTSRPPNYTMFSRRFVRKILTSDLLVAGLLAVLLLIGALLLTSPLLA